MSLSLSRQAHERGLHPKVTINCAGYKALTSMEQYMELINASLPGWKINIIVFFNGVKNGDVMKHCWKYYVQFFEADMRKQNQYDQYIVCWGDTYIFLHLHTLFERQVALSIWLYRLKPTSVKRVVRTWLEGELFCYITARQRHFIYHYTVSFWVKNGLMCLLWTIFFFQNSWRSVYGRTY